MATLLTQNEITTALAALPDWHLAADGKAITRRYQFDGFRTPSAS